MMYQFQQPRRENKMQDMNELLKKIEGYTIALSIKHQFENNNDQ